MNAIGDVFNLVFFGPVVNLLVLIYQGLHAINIPGALGFSIMFLTVIIRILVWPFMATQIKATKKMADLKPHLDEIRLKHKDDKKELAKPIAGLAEHREGMQLSFFQLDDPVLKQIRDEILGIDIDNLTPVEALNKLYNIKKHLK